MACRRLLQTNMNHSARAQDLLVQVMAERGIDLAVAAEPYAVPPADARWQGDTAGLVAIISRGGTAATPLSLADRGEGYVVCRWGGGVVVGVYISPNISIADYEARLGVIGGAVRRFLPGWVLVAGDFNAKAAEWGSPVTDTRGETLGDWVAELDLRILNRGSEPTCVAARGSSIVDITMGSPETSREVQHWRVMDEVTLSDHQYIVMEISPSSTPNGCNGHPEGSRGTPRWSLRRLDKEAALAAAIAKAWEEGPDRDHCEVEAEALWFRSALEQICDASMPRSRNAPRDKKAVYWWTSEIAALRHECNSARRQYTRYRRRKRLDREEAARLYGSYREQKKSLQAAIAKAKIHAWEELLGTLDRDPWGRPYRMVRNKLRPAAPPTTGSLMPGFLREVVAALFPEDPGEEARPREDPALVRERAGWTEEYAVTEGELARAVKRMRRKNTAPGPDGIPGRVWAIALSVLGDRLRQLFDRCLQLGRFPTAWKEARLVLIPKEGRPADEPSAYRPICLLDEVAKLLERIVAGRLVAHMSTVGPDLEYVQYGFRPGRSTTGAIRRLRSLVDRAVSRGGMALAISLDVSNAFNSLPWGSIREGLRRKGVPPYLEEIVGAYLGDRAVSCRDGEGEIMRRGMSRGVPQGSVLGPLLWNIGYDKVLRQATPAGVSFVCYADDTLVVISGDSWKEVRRRVATGLEFVLRRIRHLDLKVALHKTEALWLGGPREVGPGWSHIAVEGVRVRVKSQMKYLGLILDSHWTFRPHFESVATRLGGAVASFGRIMPNLGGPNEAVRRLFMGVVRSIALYGAPVWYESLVACKRNISLLHREQRKMAIRVARSYRTISWEAACVLAGSAPWVYVSGSLLDTYEWKEELARAGTPATRKMLETRRALAKGDVLQHWGERLPHARVGLRVVEAVQPYLKERVGRGHGGLTFRLTQVLSGHGCFGEYLHERLGREATTRCHHCPEERDTAQHTLERCPAWADERRVLTDAIGGELALPAVVEKMLATPEGWKAVASFCEAVMSQKETAERAREGDPNAAPERSRRGGRRRRRFLQQNL